jgi:hypothetical protein
MTAPVTTWLYVADDTLSDRFSCRYIEYHSTMKVAFHILFFKMLGSLRPCPSWKRRASTCGCALLPHADKHMFVYVLELCKSEAKRVELPLADVPASPRSYRVQAHKQTCVCPHGEEVPTVAGTVRYRSISRPMLI